MEYCGARSRSGGTCRKPAGWGTPHRTGRCRLHGGATRNHIAKAQRQEAEHAARVYGLPVEIDPRDALLEELWRAQGIVQWLTGEVAALQRDHLYGPVGGGGDSYPRSEPHVLIRMLGEERDRLRQVAKTCHDVGIEERQQQLAEQWGAMAATTIGGILRELGMDGDPRAPEIVRRHLLLLERGDVVDVVDGQEAA